MLQEYTRQLSPPHPRRSSTPGLSTLKPSPPRCKLPLLTQRQDNSSTGLLRQLNYVSRETYILTAPPPTSTHSNTPSSHTTCYIVIKDRHNFSRPINTHVTPVLPSQ